MTETHYPALTALLHGYFHQDWMEDGATEDEVLDGHVATTWRPDVERAIADIGRFMDEHRGAELAAFESMKADIIAGEDNGAVRGWTEWLRDGLIARRVRAPVKD